MSISVQENSCLKKSIQERKWFYVITLTMNELIILYCFVSGLIYASWLYDSKEDMLSILLCTIFAMFSGWFVTPILIGRALKKIYK